MSEQLLSVGLDVGTTTTQLIVSRLTLENRASGFAVPHMQIADRQILYESDVHFTPLVGDSLVDGDGIRRLVAAEYQKAGIRREQVDTGAVIVTGETSRKENAESVARALSEFAGDFVVTTAGPALESVLAARGAGAVAFSEATNAPVLHMDIGGGTANLALIRDGQILRAGCMNVGGRLIKRDKTGAITYVSPVIEKLCKLKPGDIPSPSQLQALAGLLTRGLEMAAGLRQPDELLEALWTKECGPVWELPKSGAVISFSGGVADCIAAALPPDRFGDIGPQLGSAIRDSLLCAGAYRIGSQTIRATVIGAGCHSASLSGSTVYCAGARLPVKDLPAVVLTEKEQDLPPEKLGNTLREKLSRQDGPSVIALRGFASPGYSQVCRLAEGIAKGITGRQVYLALMQDMAKALGQALALRLPEGSSIVCLDGVPLADGSYLDIGKPVGPCLPVVIKTLIFER